MSQEKRLTELVTLRVEVAVLLKSDNVHEASTGHQLLGSILIEHPEVVSWKFLDSQEETP
ncbi:MAG: hypothetical protein ACRC4O_02290 [Giesbergeria sp.]